MTIGIGLLGLGTVGAGSVIARLPKPSLLQRQQESWRVFTERTYQTWTIVGFLLLHHFLRTSPEDVEILDLDDLLPTANPEESAENP